MKILLLAALLFATTPAWSFLTTNETGEVVPANHYRASLGPQFIFKDSQFNINGDFDMHVDDESSARVFVGTGDTNFNTGFSYKWIPIPDYGNQPAIGGKVALIYSRKDENSGMSVILTPLISKKFETDYGLIVPYASLPFGITSIKSKTYDPFLLEMGSEWKPNGFENVSFGGELGFEINDSFSYMFAYVILTMDDNKGIQLK